MQRCEDLLEQQYLDSISELPSEYTVLIVQSALSFSAYIKKRGTFPKIHKILFRLGPIDCCHRLEWYRLYNGFMEGIAAGPVTDTRSIVPLEWGDWESLGLDTFPMISFAHLQSISVYELPQLLVLYHHLNPEHDAPVLASFIYNSDGNDPMERLLDRLQHYDNSAITPSSTPEIVVGELHLVILVDELAVLNVLNHCVGQVDRRMAVDSIVRHRLRLWRQLMARWRPYLYDKYEVEQAHLKLIEQAKTGSSKSQPLNVRWLQVEPIRLEFSGLIDEFRSKRRMILEHCESTFTMLMTTMSLMESEKAINEAEEVTKLTQLAFFFIPLTFVAGIFGMNLRVRTRTRLGSTR